MAFNLIQIKDLITRVISAQELYSEAALNLLLGTCAVESCMGTYLYQVPSRIAKGIFQIEVDTEHDIWDNYLFHGRANKRKAIYRISGVRSCNNNGAMEWNIAYGICMARLHYRRVAEPFPDADDIEGLGRYWKKYWNTIKGKGTVERFVEAFGRYVIGSTYQKD